MGVAFSLNDEERQWLSRLARESITTALEGREASPPPLPSALAGGTLAQSLGSFVTLNKDGDLRGCIGNMVGREPLWQNVWRMARAAAFEDPRFPALDAAEWPHCSLHISVLGPLSPCPDPARIVIGRHRLLLRMSALLHETGKFVNLRNYPLHSWQIIMGTDIFGITDAEKEVIACISYYYHRDNPARRTCITSA